MYDNIVLRWNQDENPKVNFLEQIPSRLLDVYKIERPDGHMYYIGSLGVFRVSVNAMMVKVDNGSLCKYWKGNNCDTLTIEEVRDALLSIGKELGLSMEKAIVGRIDFSTNLEMDYPPSVYFPLLGSCPRKARWERKNGLYFESKIFVLVFYGKVEEYKEKRYVLPEEYLGKNLLRIEIRFLKRVASQLKVKKIRGNDLYDPQFFLRLLDCWYDSYKSITKVYQGNKNLDGKTPTALLEQLAAIGVLGLGLDRVLENIGINYKSGKINKVVATRQRKRVKDLVAANSGVMNSNNDLIKELDSKVAEAVRYYKKSLEN